MWIMIRRFLWEELAGLHGWWDMPSCIGGDFNITRFPKERSEKARLCLAMIEFLGFTFELDLMEIPLVGGSFTWSNNWA